MIKFLDFERTILRFKKQITNRKYNKENINSNGIGQILIISLIFKREVIESYIYLHDTCKLYAILSL